VRDFAVDQPEAYSTQIESAYWRLREDIIRGVLQPAAKLRIEHLRQSYGLGASALREALSRLVSDGLVETEGQRGFWVAPISRGELHDITVARQVMEVGALRQSITHGSVEWEGRVVAARYSLDRVEKSMAAPSPDVILTWERSNRQFHMELLAGCPSKWLLRFVGQLYDQALRYRHRTVLRRPIPRTGVSPEHNALVDATLARDADRACGLLSEHIDNTAKSVEKAIFGEV
jgi:DNA-binding GntR family transcriptional regulator